jgi:hypothetical protein
MIRKLDELLAVCRRYRQDPALRSRALLAAVLTGLYVLLIPGILWERSAARESSTMRAKYREYSALAGEYRALKESVSVIERKRTLSNTSTIAQAIGDMTQSLGMAGKVKSIKGTGSRTAANRMNEETAEIQIEKININEMIQLLYKIENAPMILTIKTVAIAKSFENPQLLDMTLVVSLFSGASAP